MPTCPEKGQKGAVGQSQLFCILLKIGSLDFFDILHKLKFCFADFGHFWSKNQHFCMMQNSLIRFF